ncbi:hypothetical protein L3X38_000334 [Prunus dulcis]|uniref:Uncharacterized protein n=1 Tax=Prunus dulcis TaxID=3755 RepID=A0AAD4YJC7_PRUDU|nr:hypothetical protein L3X38_000334 [Prunus dulcis]
MREGRAPKTCVVRWAEVDKFPIPRKLQHGKAPSPHDGTARPPQAEPISVVGTYGSTFVSPSQLDRPQPRGRPELAEKPCFPAEVPPKLPKLPARNSPSFLHQIDRVRHQEPDRITKDTSEGSK